MNMTAEDRKALRDLFASQALVGLAANPNFHFHSHKERKEIVAASYDLADYMMNERKQWYDDEND